MKDKLIGVRVNTEQLERLKKTLGVDDSKTIRACMNCADNVIHNLFGGEVKNIFRRKKTNEELDLYENP
jgi:hypothetical protein|tara:strand:+ start:194 stop:400 length:207 start_codon:yes stop_codon:yes gene_type:complete